MAVDVDLDPADGVLTLTGDTFLLIVAANPSDLLRLDGVGGADWSARASIAVGTTSLGRVFWCAGEAEGTVHVLVGHDDETWDLALVIPEDAVRSIVQQARAAAEAGEPPVA